MSIVLGDVQVRSFGCANEIASPVLEFRGLAVPMRDDQLCLWIADMVLRTERLHHCIVEFGATAAGGWPHLCMVVQATDDIALLIRSKGG